MKLTLLLGILFAAAVIMAATGGAKAAGVSVKKTTFRGWAGAIRISNGVVEAVVVPEIGRIMLFQWVSRPESDPIFLNHDLAGKTAADVPTGTWANFGGDKLWPAPQSDWPKHAPQAWPPDGAFDGMPFQAEIVSNGVRLVGPWSKAFAARAIRTITMRPGQPRLYIAQEIEKEPSAPGAFPIGVWSITQTRPDGTIFLPLPAGADGQASYHMLGGDKLTPGWSVRGDLLVGMRDPKITIKVGSSGRQGWMASLYAGDVLFSEHYKYDPSGGYPDGGSTAEVYTNGGDLGYIEMEVLGPLANLAAGSVERYDVYWQLTRLPRTPADTDDACRLVKDAMK